MLNEWNDRDPDPKKPRRFFASPEFVIGFGSTLVFLAILAGVGGWVFS